MDNDAHTYKVGDLVWVKDSALARSGGVLINAEEVQAHGRLWRVTAVAKSNLDAIPFHMPPLATSEDEPWDFYFHFFEIEPFTGQVEGDPADAR